MSDFGKLLRYYRERCMDLERGKRLTQERLGELILQEMGTGNTGSAISEWERGKSQINKDHRLVLTSLIKVLYKCEGLKTLDEAQALLSIGNYRQLDNAEIEQIFPGSHDGNPSSEMTLKQRSPFLSLFQPLVSSFNEAVEMLQASTTEGPPPHWPRVPIAAVGMLFKNWSSEKRISRYTLDHGLVIGLEIDDTVDVLAIRQPS
ncbi:hypothetical protein ACFLZW_02115 [Chloroflexota bacterium]